MPPLSTDNAISCAPKFDPQIVSAHIKRRKCREGNCRSVQRGDSPCSLGECAHKAGLLVQNPSITQQRTFLTKRLHGGKPRRCQAGRCRSLKRRGLPCVAGQCVASAKAVHSGARLHEYAQVHGHRDKGGAIYWELVGLTAVREAPSPESLNTRSDDASRLARQQRDYACRKLGKRRRRKQNQKLKRLRTLTAPVPHAVESG
jgi:hypothetical protein